MKCKNDLNEVGYKEITLIPESEIILILKSELYNPDKEDSLRHIIIHSIAEKLGIKL